MSHLQAFIHRRLGHRPNLLRAVDSIAWLVADKLLRLTLGLLISVWVARHLGPDQFGRLSYAITLVAIFWAIASLGLQGILVREIVKSPDRTGELMGTGFVLQFVGALVTLALLVAVIALLRPDDSLSRVLVMICGLSLIFRSSEVVRYWFESQVQSRYVVWAEASMFLIASALRIGLILMDASVTAFAWAFLIESALIAMGFLAVYLKRGEALSRWRIDSGTAVELLRESWPMIFMALMLGVYTKIDILMVEHFLGWEATGLYSAALLVAEAWYFLAVVLTTSLYPNLIAAHARDEAELRGKLSAFYALMFWTPLAVSLVLALGAQPLMTLLYGEQYAGVAEVFRIYVWSSIFVFVTTASSRWFLLQGATRSLMYRAVVGAVSNVVLNYYLIQRLGLTGAAISTLISYALVAYGYDFLDAKARGQILIKLAAPLRPLIWLTHERRSPNR